MRLALEPSRLEPNPLYDQLLLVATKASFTTCPAGYLRYKLLKHVDE